MALTRPKIWDLDTTIEAFVDPITVLHQGASQPNIDVGFLMNRANGLVSNVAIYWSESANTFVTAFTTSTGVTNSNIVVTSYANLSLGTLTTTNGIFWANGTAYSSGGGGSFTGGVISSTTYPSGNLTLNLGTTTGYWANVYTGNLIVGQNILWGNGTVFSSGSGTYGNTQAAAYILIDPTVSGIQANVGAFEIFANSNAAGQATSLNSINANLGSYQNTNNANIGSVFNNLNTLNANVGSYENTTNANLGTATTNISALQANVGSYENTTNANIGTIFNNFNTLNANVGAYENTTNANIGTLFLGNALTQANLGAYQTWANATFATSGGPSTATIAANLGAYQIYANANVGTIFNNLNTLNANVGTYENTTNANIGTIRTLQLSHDANIGAFELYANTKIGTNTNSNLVVVATTPSTTTTTGALVVGGGVGIAGNIYVGSSAGNSIVTTGNAVIGGGVGIGLTPQYPLHVNIASTGITVARFAGGSNIVDIYAGSGGTSYIGDAGAHNAFGFNTSGNWLDIWTSNEEVARFTSIGDLVVSNNVGSIPQALGGHGIYAQGNIVTANTTPSTSTTTGALQVAGGAGIQGALWIANAGDVSANIGAFHTFANTAISSLFTNANANTSAYLSAGVSGNIKTSSNVFATGVFIGSGSAISGLFWSANNQPVSTGGGGSGVTQIIAGTNVTISPAGGTGAVTINATGGGSSFTGGYVPDQSTFGANLVANSATTSTSTTTGALVVAGGAGISGDVWAGNVVTANGVFWANGAVYSTGGGGGGGSPAGATGSIQYNNGGSFGGTALTYFSGNTDVATTGNISVTGDLSVAGSIYDSGAILPTLGRVVNTTIGWNLP